MKTMYIPKGRTVSCDFVTAERLVVNGRLNVSGDIAAKTISGSGFVSANIVLADDICVDDLSADSVVCRILFAKRVRVAELFASEQAAASCYLAAERVTTDRLLLSMHQIDDMRAGEVVRLKPKKRSLFRLLLESALRSLWFSVMTPKVITKAPDAASAKKQTAA